MNSKQLSAILTTALLLVSTLPAVVPHGIILDQGDKTAALIGDVFSGVSEEIYVQYLGNETARLHWSFYNENCNEITNGIERVTPLQIVQILGPEGDPDRKLVVVVEDLAGDRLLNQPLIGTIYFNDRTAVKNIPGLTAVTNITGAVIGDAGIFASNGAANYSLLPMNYIHLPFLVDETGSPTVSNSLAINIFNATPQFVEQDTFNDIEDSASSNLDEITCAGLTDIAIAGFQYSDIGEGIGQGIPPGIPITNAGVGVIKSSEEEGRLLVESVFGDETLDVDAISNVFYFDDGEPFTLEYEDLPPLPPLSAPQGIFTGKNENYQNPRLTGALASIGIQKPIEPDGLNNNNESLPPSNFNIDTVFAIYNNEDEPAEVRKLKARFDFISLDPSSFNECNHKDFNMTLTPNDVEYVRVSQLTGGHLLPGDSPIIGVLTVWDPENGETLAGYRWDVIMETQPECNDGVDNDNDGTTDGGDLDCVDEFDDSESDGVGNFTDREDVIDSVLDQEVMLTLDSTVENGIASFEAAEHATTLVPTMAVTDSDDFNLVYVNWDGLDDPTALDQVLAFQVMDMEENTKSIKIPTTECITLLDKQSFPSLSDGSAFGTSPSVVSYTGKFDQPNRGLAAFLFYNKNGLLATEDLDDARNLAFTNNHHDGEIFADVKIMPGTVPGPGGTFIVEVGVTPSVTQINVNVTVRWFAAVPDGADPAKLVRGPLICDEKVNHNLVAGEAFGIKVSCPIDPLSIDAFLEVESTPLTAMGRVSIFVPKTT